jgi:hypothetical protein
MEQDPNQEVTGFEYTGRDQEIDGFEKDWEYPLDWIQDPHEVTTGDVAMQFPSSFEPVYTPFPTPSVPRPKK